MQPKLMSLNQVVLDSLTEELTQKTIQKMNQEAPTDVQCSYFRKSASRHIEIIPKYSK